MKNLKKKNRWLHLCFNLVVQLLVGLPLEMVHGSTRIGIVYMSGVLAGSLGTSIFDSDVCLVGASGGVYALLAAHLSNVLLNYNSMRCGILRLLGIIAIGNTYIFDQKNNNNQMCFHIFLQLPVMSDTPYTLDTLSSRQYLRSRT